MPRHKKRVFFNPETKQVISTTQNQINSDLYTEINVPIRHAEIKSMWTTHTKCKSICMLTLKTGDFRPAFKHQVNFDHRHIQINFTPTLKSSRIRFPTLKSSKFGPPTTNKSIIMLILKTSDFRPACK